MGMMEKKVLRGLGVGTSGVQVEGFRRLRVEGFRIGLGFRGLGFGV